MGFSRQECWSGLPSPSPVDHILSELCFIALDFTFTTRHIHNSEFFSALAQSLLSFWSYWQLPSALPQKGTTEWLHFHLSVSCIGEGNGNPLQCSCLENPRDGGSWWAAVYEVTQSWTRLKWLSSSSSFPSSRPFNLGDSSFGVIYFCLFILFMVSLWQNAASYIQFTASRLHLKMTLFPNIITFINARS